jgi:hypothetical protein
MVKNLMTSILLCLILCFTVVPTKAQTWVTANQITVAWDAVTVGSGTVSYDIFIKPEVGGTTTKIGNVSTTQATFTFTTEGRYFLGVNSVRTIGIVVIPSDTVSWSNVAIDCQGGVMFGAQYYNPPTKVKNLRNQ